jgi:hypothetical protein
MTGKAQRQASSPSLPERDPLAPLVDAVAERVAARLPAARPEFITQRTVAAIVGMPPRDFLRHSRERDWPSYVDRRLRYARTADVLAYLEAHHVHDEDVDQGDVEARVFAMSGARRVARQ